MRGQDVIKLSTRMFKTNPSRTWLTILGMGVGIGAVVLLVGLGFGLQGVLLEQIVFGETLLSLTVSNPSSRAVLLSPEAISDFFQIENVRDVSPLASFSSLMTFGDLTANTSLQAVNPSYFRYAGLSTIEGDLFTDEQSSQDRGKVLLSTGALRLFGIESSTDALGKRVRFRALVPKKGTDEIIEVSLEKSYVIKGVIDNPSNAIAFMPLTEFQANFSVTSFDRAQVRVESTDFLNYVQDELVNKGFRVTALSKTVEQANKIFQGVQMILALFGGIALIVSAIGMFNTMTVTLLERTNEIGIMRTIGASPGNIKILFVTEAVIVGFLGGVVGIGIGVIIGKVINILINTLAVRFGGIAIDLFRYPLPFIAFILVFSGVVGFTTGIFPARRAASLNPLDAIRYK